MTNEKLINIFEEVSLLQGFFKEQLTYFQEIQQEIGIQNGNSEMSESFRHILDVKTTNSINTVQQFQATFDAITKNKPLEPTIQSEAKRLDEAKNCAYHRAKIQELLVQLNKSVEQNIGLSEENTKLRFKKRNLKDRLEVTTRKLQEVMALAPSHAKVNNESLSPTQSPTKSPRPFKSGEPSSPTISPNRIGRVSGMSARFSMATNDDQMSQGHYRQMFDEVKKGVEGISNSLFGQFIQHEMPVNFIRNVCEDI